MPVKEKRSVQKNICKPKVVVGMSGGVDSSMALYLLKQQGYEPIGVSLKYEVWKDHSNFKENVCCTAESFRIAKHICNILGVKHHIIKIEKKFKKEVVDYFVSELQEKRTPNPCVLCNRLVKFDELIKFAKKHNIKYVATGHYAQIKQDPKTKEYSLHRGKDETKDQTYSLSFLHKDWLPKIILPLGNLTKNEVYELAQKAGFGFYLYKKQSQDFCYVSDKSMRKFLEKVIGLEKGPIIEKDKIVGYHQGLHFYTIGQRKGLEIPNGPYFVIDMDLKKNALIVTKDTDDKNLFKKELILKPYNLLIKDFKKTIKVQAKIRYGQPLSSAVIYPQKNKQIRIVFSKPQRAVTLGQYAVFYEKNRCLGSGRIVRAN